MTQLVVITCIACNKEFIDEKHQKKHYNSEWHRYNLKCKMAGVPGMTEELFLARQPTLETEEKRKLNKPPIVNKEELDEEGDESEEVDQNDDLVDEMTPLLNHMKMDGVNSDDDDVEVDPSCCFMCDQKHKTIQRCMIHMHKHHGLFIPDVGYLKDPGGFLTYLGLKVKRDFTCLYCNINCHTFDSLEAVRMHMVAKSHCRVHNGDSYDEDEEAELDEFYDYSNSFVDVNGKQLVTADGTGERIELGSCGSALMISKVTDNGISTKIIGSRQYLRYYRQKIRPTSNGTAITAVQAARHRSICLSMVQSKGNMVRMKLLKQQGNKPGVELTRCKIAIKSTVTRNFSKSVLH